MGSTEYAEIGDSVDIEEGVTIDADGEAKGELKGTGELSVDTILVLV